MSVLWEDAKQHDVDLRLACQAALCTAEMCGRPLLDPSSVFIYIVPCTLGHKVNRDTT